MTFKVKWHQCVSLWFYKHLCYPCLNVCQIIQHEGIYVQEKNFIIVMLHQIFRHWLYRDLNSYIPQILPPLWDISRSILRYWRHLIVLRVEKLRLWVVGWGAECTGSFVIGFLMGDVVVKMLGNKSKTFCSCSRIWSANIRYVARPSICYNRKSLFSTSTARTWRHTWCGPNCWINCVTLPSMKQSNLE